VRTSRMGISWSGANLAWRRRISPGAALLAPALLPAGLLPDMSSASGLSRGQCRASRYRDRTAQCIRGTRHLRGVVVTLAGVIVAVTRESAPVQPIRMSTSTSHPDVSDETRRSL
jgi:hypothetical protein